PVHGHRVAQPVVRHAALGGGPLRDHGPAGRPPGGVAGGSPGPVTEPAPPAPPPSPPSPPRRNYVVEAVSKGLNRLGRDRTATTLALFAFLIAKVLLVTHGDLLTSLALIHDAGLV